MRLSIVFDRLKTREQLKFMKELKKENVYIYIGDSELRLLIIFFLHLLSIR